MRVLVPALAAHELHVIHDDPSQDCGLFRLGEQGAMALRWRRGEAGRLGLGEPSERMESLSWKAGVAPTNG